MASPVLMTCAAAESTRGMSTMACIAGEAFEGYRTPDWANKPPKQPESLTAKACYSCHSEPDDVPEHPAFAVTRPSTNEKRPLSLPRNDRYRKPKETQMGILYEGFRQLSTVSLCFKEGEVEQLRASEAAELTAAHGRVDVPCDANAALPRAFALTLLIRESRLCVPRRTWLDCMAYWANCGEADEVAAGHARFAVLADQDARKYSVEHGQGLKETAELALVFVAPDGKVDMVKSPLPYKDTGRKMFKALRTTAAQLFDHAQQPAPSALFRTMEVGSETVADAYVLSYKRTADAFWATMIEHAPPPELHGELLAFADIYVKIAQDATMRTPQGWTHEKVDYGLLFYKKGMQDQLHEFLLKARGEELAKGVNEREACLRPADQDADELNLNLHILRASHRFVDLARKVSCFGTRTSPGALLTPWFKDQLGWQGLVFDLQPFTRETYNWNYVLPVEQDNTLDLVDMHAYPQWNLTCLAWTVYGDCFVEDGEESSLEALMQPLKRPRKPEGAPGPEDAVLATLVGDPFFSGPVRVGDVYERLSQDARVKMPALAAFLVSAIGQLGPDAPMSRALATCAELRRACAEEVAALRAELAALRNAAPPPVQAPEPDAGPFPFGVAKRIITGMGLERNPCFKLAPTLTNAQRAKVIVRIIAEASGGAEDPAEVKWCERHCKGMDNVDAVAAAGERAAVASKSKLLIAVHNSGEAQFLETVTREDGSLEKRPVDLKTALTISIKQRMIMVLYREESTQLIACKPVATAA